MRKENVISRISISIAFTLFFIGFILVILFAVIPPFNDWSFEPDAGLFANYGTFIGGMVGPILTFASVLLLYKTLISQQDAIERQEQAFLLQQSNIEKESFENTFFNLLRTQQELTQNIKAYFKYLDKKFSEVNYTINGKEFFDFSKKELEYIWESLNKTTYLGTHINDEETLHYLEEEIMSYYDPSSPDYEPDYLAEQHEKEIRYRELLKFKNKFYNITEQQWTAIKDLSIEEKIEKTYGIFFQKYHYAIGHYFRHLYHIIKFVKDYKPKHGIDNDINMKYVNFIQAQMSSFEMMLLFYNSMSFPNLKKLLIEYDFLENLAEEDLVIKEHNCIEGINLKSRKNLL